MAAQLSLAREPGQRGIVLTNGEFGERLADQARRFGLEHSVLESGWGEALPYDRARRALSAGRFHWLWAAHCETSTGILNDLERLKGLAQEGGLRLCLDAISSLGTVPVDLEGVDLASGVSGKGLASYPGLSFVFHQAPIGPASSLPRYLDPRPLRPEPGDAVHRLVEPAPGAEREASTGWRRHLANPRGGPSSPGGCARGSKRWGSGPRAEPALASPAVLTLIPPPPWRAFALGEALDGRGFLLSYRSEYLEQRNLIQVCLMGEHSLREGEMLLEALMDILAA